MNKGTHHATITITFTLTDLPEGKGVTVQTDAAAPSIGQPCTPAQALAMDLLRTCRRHCTAVQYGYAASTLAGELLAARAEGWLHHTIPVSLAADGDSAMERRR